MRRYDEKVDLRLLSLLHALHDKEEFIRELRRLTDSCLINDVSWQEICKLGRDLAPENSLFTTPAGVNFADTREQERMPGKSFRNIAFDRRGKDRRSTKLPWLGTDRRIWQRRHSVRRQIDP